jgi:hypothetical protein
MSEELEPLSLELSRALDAERARPPVSADQVSRLASRLESTFVLGTAAAAPVVAASVASKVALVTAGLLVGGVSGALLHAQLATPREVIVEKRVEVKVPVEVRVEVPVVPPVDVKPTARVQVPTPVPAPPSITQADGERLLIEQASAAVARGKGEDALTACDAHSRKFPSGQLAEERESLAIRALVLLGRRDEASVRATQFKARYPDSLLSDVVDAALK